MIKLIISGVTGAMGKQVMNLAFASPYFEVVAGIGHGSESMPFPVFERFDDLKAFSCDCIIDFSNPVLTEDLLTFAVSKSLPVVLCTTGLDHQLQLKVEESVQHIPIFQSGNMSVGINLLKQLLETAAQVLGKDADIEIIEKHHHRKIDAPSGTALMLANAVNKGLEKDRTLQLGRDARGAKDRSIINIHAVRGGNIIGEHDVIFAIDDEIIEISHTAYSRTVFAKGALDAATFLVSQPPGHYNMDDLLKSRQ